MPRNLWYCYRNPKTHQEVRRSEPDVRLLHAGYRLINTIDLEGTSDAKDKKMGTMPEDRKKALMEKHQVKDIREALRLEREQDKTTVGCGHFPGDTITYKEEGATNEK